MTFNERVNIKMLHYLLDFEFNDFVDICKYKNNNNQQHQKDYRLFKKNLYDMLQHKGKVNRKYCFVGTKQYGRRYCSGLQSLKKVFRGALCKGISTDIDVVNCHPSILEYICLTYNIDCSCLKTYNANREKYLEKMMAVEKISREEAKEAFLIATNTQYQQRKYQFSFYTSYDNEMKEIQQELMKLDDFKEMKEDAKKENKAGSFVNLVMCKYENEILENIIECVSSKSLEIQTLMFDGLTIYGDHYNNPSLLMDIEEYLAKTWNFQIKLSYKEHMDEIIIKKEVKEVLCYKDVKTWFEKKHLKVGKFYLKEEEGGIVIIFTRKEFADTYEHLPCIKENLKEDSFTSEWFRDMNIRRLDKMDIYPNNLLCPKDTYNLWIPFVGEQYGVYEHKQEAIDLFYKQINYLCDHHKESFEFVIIWLAHMIQYAENKSVMLVFVGKQGSAKTWLILLLQKMLGIHKVLVTSEPSRDVWGHFNSLMKDAFLVNLNEISRKEFVGAEGRIKQLITEPIFTFHDKGKSAINLKSYHRFLGTTNDEEAVPSHEGDRRSVIIRSSDEIIINGSDTAEVKKTKQDYFDQLYGMLEDDDAIMSVYNELKQIKNIPSMISKTIMPLTNFQSEMQALNRDSVELFLEHLAMNEDTDFTWSCNCIWNQYQAFCNEHGHKYDYLNSTKFGSRLGRKKIYGISDSFPKKEGGKVIKHRSFDIKKLREHFKIGVCLVPDKPVETPALQITMHSRDRYRADELCGLKVMIKRSAQREAEQYTIDYDSDDNGPFYIDKREDWHMLYEDGSLVRG